MFSRLTLSFSCTGLANKDTFSKSDPQIWLFMDDTVVGKTEMIKDNLNPVFSTTIEIEFHFEARQNVVIHIVDIDKKSNRLADHDSLGTVTTTVAALVNADNGTFCAKIVGGKGTLQVVTEEVGNSNDIVRLALRGVGLPKMDGLFGKADPYFIVSKVREDGSWTRVHQSEIVKKTLNPHWKPFDKSVGVLCGGDLDRTLKFDCYDWDKVGSHDYIGSCTMAVRDLLVGGASFPLINEKKKAKKKKYTDSGQLVVAAGTLIERKSFVQYLQSGLQMNLMVAVDFTASNGSPSLATSLHYASPHTFNQYQQAIQAVGSVLLDYDADKMVPIYGYGAKIPPNGQVSHCFPLTFNPTQPEVHGVDGMLAAYSNGLSNVQLYGPTNMGPILSHARQIVAARPHEYLVMMILTDGVISDQQKTINEIVECSNLPISIVIVGVGNADFTAMDELDGDDAVLMSSSGVPAKRDIVQFVPYTDFARQGPAALAAEILREIPDQVVAALNNHH